MSKTIGDTGNGQLRLAIVYGLLVVGLISAVVELHQPRDFSHSQTQIASAASRDSDRRVAIRIGAHADRFFRIPSNILVG